MVDIVEVPTEAPVEENGESVMEGPAIQALSTIRDHIQNMAARNNQVDPGMTGLQF